MLSLTDKNFCESKVTMDVFHVLFQKVPKLRLKNQPLKLEIQKFQYFFDSSSLLFSADLS